MPAKVAAPTRNHSANGSSKRRRASKIESSGYVTFRMFSLTPSLDHALRKRATEKGTTMNEVIREILTKELHS
jgi:hypothetical protein